MKRKQISINNIGRVHTFIVFIFRTHCLKKNETGVDIHFFHAVERDRHFEADLVKDLEYVITPSRGIKPMKVTQCSTKFISEECAHQPQISFQSFPTVIHPVLTKKITLRCSVKQSNRYYHAFSQLTDDGVFGHGDFPTGSAYQNPVSHVTAILVGKVNATSGLIDPVASVTPFEPATVKTDECSGSVRVVGASNESTSYSEIGYLQVTWERPLEENAGEFVCEVYGLNDTNHPVSLNATLKVESSQPAIDDVIGFISKQDRLIDALEQSIIQLTADVRALEVSFAETHPLTREEPRAQNIQKGSSSCQYMYSQQVKFPKSFDSAPLVLVSITSIRRTSYGSVGSIDDYTITTSKVNASCFYVDCSFKYDMSVSFEWLAIDS
ncbi:hypothetical protein Btru_057393 [Bulinus truncatus]|nr:hypothetical protein Btru_057393 [Bulinus truncatus]